jgi:hypothetical protein
MKMIFEKETGDAVKQCIKVSTNCHNICTEAMRYCLIEGGPYAELPHIRNLIDCYRICALNTDSMLLESEYEAPIANLCAKVCDNCADSCARFSDDEKMLLCSKICRECSEACRDMIDSHGHTEV